MVPLHLVEKYQQLFIRLHFATRSFQHQYTLLFHHIFAKTLREWSYECHIPFYSFCSFQIGRVPKPCCCIFESLCCQTLFSINPRTFLNSFYQPTDVSVQFHLQVPNYSQFQAWLFARSGCIGLEKEYTQMLWRSLK